MCKIVTNELCGSALAHALPENPTPKLRLVVHAAQEDGGVGRGG